MKRLQLRKRLFSWAGCGVRIKPIRAGLNEGDNQLGEQKAQLWIAERLANCWLSW